jgi:L-fucose isomerase
MVGMLGAGGALDQIGYDHIRVFDHRSVDGVRRISAFILAARAKSDLVGQKLGLFGGPSLGIFTANIDPAQWEQLYHVGIEYIDQLEIVKEAEALDSEEVNEQINWLTSRVSAVIYNHSFTREKLTKQVRSYLATRTLAEKHKLDFVGVKCQPELTDGYVSQCAVHLLANSGIDRRGSMPVLVHACESDADGALTMQIMHLITGKSPALLDLRCYLPSEKVWIVANCGAIPACFFSTPDDPDGFKELSIEPHILGSAGSGAFPGKMTPRKVTLARLCRRSRNYWMAIMSGEILPPKNGKLDTVTPVFPKAYIKTSAAEEFLNEFSSNHIHMVNGEITQELEYFCRLVGIDYKVY